jgi:toxin HigB-1
VVLREGFGPSRRKRSVSCRFSISAKDLNDLRVPPGNRLEKLGGDRRGQYSIRINDQWRICFRWRDEGPWDVEIVDYH